MQLLKNRRKSILNSNKREIKKGMIVALVVVIFSRSEYYK